MIGVIVEGIGEVPALKSILGRIDPVRQVLQTPLRADLQPKANPLVIARSARTAVNQLRSRGASRIVVLIDREDNPCPVTFAAALGSAFLGAHPDLHFSVVIKNHCFENWLLADISALKANHRRFAIPRTLERKASRGLADQIQNPIEELNRSAVTTGYHKGQDPLRIVNAADIAVIAQNSRSFRKFLREVTHRPYAGQSRKSI